MPDMCRFSTMITTKSTTMNDNNTIELHKGRPEVSTGRLPREIKTCDFLDSPGIEYYRTVRLVGEDWDQQGVTA